MNSSVKKIRLPRPVANVTSLQPRMTIRELLSESAKKQSYRDGYKEGYEQAANELRQQLAEESDKWNTQLNTTLQQLQSQEAVIAGQMKSALQDLLFKTVKRLLNGFTPDTATMKSILEEALAEYPCGEPNLRVWLHPDDLKMIQELESEWRRKHPDLILIGDDTLSRGDCFVSGRFGIVDGKINTKLMALADTLQ